MIPFLTQHINWPRVALNCYWNHPASQFSWPKTRGKNTEHLQCLQTTEALNILKRRIAVVPQSRVCNGSDIIGQLHSKI